MAAIVSAMGLFGNDSQDLPLDHINESRAWKFGHIAPFAGRLAVERLDCVGYGKRVRVIVNEALVDIPFCKSDTYGTCGLDDFVESQRFARVDGQEKWKECFEGER